MHETRSYRDLTGECNPPEHSGQLVFGDGQFELNLQSAHFWPRPKSVGPALATPQRTPSYRIYLVFGLGRPACTSVAVYCSPFTVPRSVFTSTLVPGFSPFPISHFPASRGPAFFRHLPDLPRADYAPGPNFPALPQCFRQAFELRGVGVHAGWRVANRGEARAGDEPDIPGVHIR